MKIYSLCKLTPVKTIGIKIGRVNNHQLKLVALPVSGFACPPLAVVTIHQLKPAVFKSKE